MLKQADYSSRLGLVFKQKEKVMSKTFEVSGITPGRLRVYDANDGMEPQFMPRWCVANNNWHNSENEEDPCIHATLDAGTKEDAELFAEAGTVTNETGLTPRQLAEQRAELLAVLQKIMQQIKKSDYLFKDSSEFYAAHDAIKKATAK